MAYTQEVLAKIYKRVPTDNMCIYCSINKKYMKEVEKWKKSRLSLLFNELFCKVILVLLYNGQAGDPSPLFKEQRKKKARHLGIDT